MHGEEEGEWCSRGVRMDMGWACGRPLEVDRSALRVLRFLGWEMSGVWSFGWRDGCWWTLKRDFPHVILDSHHQTCMASWVIGVRKGGLLLEPKVHKIDPWLGARCEVEAFFRWLQAHLICNDIKDQMFWMNSKCGNFLSIKKNKKK